jgi:hypothetical protein
MILGFKRIFPWGDETMFREKIMNGIKLHTFRADPYNRWKPCMSIQMVYRGPKYSILDHFNKGIPELESLSGKQEVKIIWFYKNEYVETSLPLRTIAGPHGEFDYYPAIWIDGRQLKEPEIKQLAINDGFDSVEDFFRWFKHDWSGKILHWTDLRY